MNVDFIQLEFGHSTIRYMTDVLVNDECCEIKSHQLASNIKHQLAL